MHPNIVTDVIAGMLGLLRYLAQHHRDILTEFQKLAEIKAFAA
jgi:hypothetical protein